jgi:predicted ABC-type ATPase
LSGDPVLHLLVGPNGSGKSTLWRYVLEPVLHLEFVNADEIAAVRFPGDPEGRSYEAAKVASGRRRELIDARASFATETVFSHESKVELVSTAAAAGYLVTLHVVAIPRALAVDRVEHRVENGGHAVPPDKVLQRYDRLWRNVVDAALVAEHVLIYDNTTASAPFRLIAEVERGDLLWCEWPAWVPADLLALGAGR